jgi:hypothetical protein
MEFTSTEGMACYPRYSTIAAWKQLKRNFKYVSIRVCNLSVPHVNKRIVHLPLSRREYSK